LNKKIFGIFLLLILIATPISGLFVSDSKSDINQLYTFVLYDHINEEPVEIEILKSDLGKKYSMPTVLSRGENLAPNPSFEEGDVKPDYWYYWDIHDVQYPWDGIHVHSGEKSVGITNVEQSFYGGLLYVYNWASDFIPVDLNNNFYEFSVYYKFIGIPTQEQIISLEIAVCDENHELITGSIPPTTYFPFSSDWTVHKYYTSWFNNPNFKDAKYVVLFLTHHFSDINWDNRIPPGNPDFEIRYDDVYFGVVNITSTPPYPPGIPQGPSTGLTGKSYTYTVQVPNDPDGDQVYLLFNWDDESYSEWLGPFTGGTEASESHTWTTTRTNRITVKAKDIHGSESQWSEAKLLAIQKGKMIPKLLIHDYINKILKHL
jgi:hypothetical protein